MFLLMGLIPISTGASQPVVMLLNPFGEEGNFIGNLGSGDDQSVCKEHSSSSDALLQLSTQNVPIKIAFTVSQD